MINVFMDGDSWCALYGSDLMEGVYGFGDTQAEALRDFANNLEQSGAIL